MKKNYVKTINLLLCLGAFASAMLILCGGLLFSVNIAACIIAVVAGLAVMIRVIIAAARKKAEQNEYMSLIADSRKVTTGNVLSLFPMPLCVLHIAGDIVWFNEKMSEMLKMNDLYGVKLDKLMPQLNWESVIKSGRVDRTVEWKDKHYHVLGSVISADNAADDDEEKYSVYLYFADKTQEVEITQKYLEEQYDTAVISIDNYDYLLQKTDDSQGQEIVYQINQYINAWIKESEGIIKKLDRDKYFALFEHKYLDMYIDKRFDVLTKVRQLSENAGIPISLTIGIGTGGKIAENEAGARYAFDLAIGRGGDMVAVKEPAQYRFYASKTKEYDKSTKAKARASALAIKSFITSVDKVIIVGHSGADYDCFGAAMGMQRAVRFFGRKPYIVCDNMSGVEKLYDKAQNMDEYEGMFVSCERAADIADFNTLVIVVDTHRPALLASREVLKKTDKVVLIDHHRRSTDFITPVSLTHHEPYASSTCEMVTELVQFMGVGDKLTGFEAQCLYMGIIMDTKNFILKTGVRTFEAASYLRRAGLDTVAVKQMFAVDKTEFDEKCKIIEHMERFYDVVGISVVNAEYKNIRVIASQAADGMMSIENIDASFVIYPLEGSISISARSFGNINVQEILEQLGGGGHLTGAGAQIKGCGIDQVRYMLIDAIGKYLTENE